MIRKILPILLIFFTLFSCKKKVDSTDGDTWIGGQIVNPNLDYIIISQGSAILDTVKLDSNNFFLYRADKLEEGLYSIRHMETQVFYIQPGDSILMHLNTIEFDETLAYSGKGAEKNNLLMDLYLRNERENKLLPKWYTLSPEKFTLKIDSIKSEKENEFKDFLSRNEVSEGFKEVAQTSIKYDYFSKKELYAMGNRGRSEILDENFFAYRKEIDFNKEKLRFYYPYYRFLNRYFNGLMISKFPPNIDRDSYEFSVAKLKTIDSTITNDSIKNSLIRYTALRYLSCAKNAEEEKEFFKLFSTLNDNPKHRQQIEQLTEAAVKMARGNKIPDVQILTMENVTVAISSVINRPTVLYFWSEDSPRQAQMTHNRAAELKSKYPEYSFLAINTDTHFKKWRNTVKKYGYDVSKEFQVENVLKAEKSLVLGTMSKAIIVDKNAMILDGSTNMFHTNFEELLLGFLNQ